MTLTSPSLPTPDLAAEKAALLARLRAGQGGEVLVGQLQAVLARGVQRTSEDAELLMGLAQQAWIADQRNPTATRACMAAQALVSMLPNMQAGYHILGLTHLSRGEYREAFLAFTAGGRTKGPVNMDNFKALAENMMLGTTQTSFTLDGYDFTFDLSCHNSMTAEAGAFHSAGMLTEINELRALATLGSERAIKTIAEIRVLMGNHTAYFLKAFKPKHLILVDADPVNLPFIERTVRHNFLGEPPQLDLVNAFIGAGGGETMFAGARVPHRTVNDVITVPIDFLKIDVDGAEAALLSGINDVIERSHPLVMIDTMPSTHVAVSEWFASHAYEALQSFDHGDYTNTIWRYRP